jgi:hypothetical protein
MDLPPWVAWAQPAHAQAAQQRLAIKEEQQRRAKAADVEAKLKAAEAEQQRLKEEVQRQAEARILVHQS